MSRTDNDGIEQIDGCQDYPIIPADSHRLQDIDSHEHNPEAGRDSMELETMSRVTKDDNDVEDEAREESFAGVTDTMNGSRENPQNQRPNSELPAEDQRSSVDLEAQDQLGRGPGDGRGGGRDNGNYANGNADGGLNGGDNATSRRGGRLRDLVGGFIYLWCLDLRRGTLELGR